jgi:hypothetical protein
MRTLFIASTMLLALAVAPAMAKPTTAAPPWNLRAVLAPPVDLNVVPGPQERGLLIVRPSRSPAPMQPVEAGPDQPPTQSKLAAVAP